jgi:CheY-like chemotaxis protein
MSVDTGEGAGSVVFLHGPRASRLADPQRQESNAGQHGLVLVIDDESQVRHVSQRYLELLGYRVEQARNAYEGLALFAARHPDYCAVLLDLKMPGKDGWQCLNELRAIRPRIPVVICSGYDPGERQLHMAHRRVAFLKKPYRADDLATVLRNLLGT